MGNRFLQILFIAGLAVFTNCSAPEKVIQKNNASVDYTLIYTIHADASYSFHVDGTGHKADEKVLDEAIEVAESSKHGEVFIFHQKSERKILFLFPKKDRKWYHYHSGELMEKGRYSPVDGGFTAESDIYTPRKAATSNRRIFLYFGHEIPSQTALPYHQSQPDYLFNTEVFTNSFSSFENHFDLAVLSTCNNGNPLMAQKLHGKTDYLVASPRNLHLSHLDTHKLHLLEENPEISVDTLANAIAESSFNRLSESVQTMVTVGAYDLSEVGNYIDDFAGRYLEHLKRTSQPSLFVDNIDCNKLEIFQEWEIPVTGAELYYQSPAFGRQAEVSSHSPWGCKE